MSQPAMKHHRKDAAQRVVLVIDDEDSSLQLARIALEQLGFVHIVLASDGTQALQAMDRMAREPDYVLCDIFMPDSDGIELVNALAARHFAGGLVLVTGGDTQYLVIAKRIARFHGLQLLASLTKPLQAGPLGHALFGAVEPEN